MRLKSITKDYLITNTRAYTRYDGSVWAVTNTIAIRLPKNYNLKANIKFVGDKFIPDMLAYDQKSDRHMMDLDRYVEEYWKLALRDYRNIELHIRIDDESFAESFAYGYNSKYVKMFNWHTDARYSINICTGLMYVTESIVGTLMGIILPIKLRGGD